MDDNIKNEGAIVFAKSSMKWRLNWRGNKLPAAL